MAFTVDDAKTLAENNTDEELTDAQAIAWANEFMRQKVDSRRWAEDDEEYADATADDWEDLPDDFGGVVDVLDENDESYEDYTIRSRQIKFAEDGDYTLQYRVLPTALDAVGDAVSLPDTYLDPLAYFMASRFRSYDDPEDTDAQHWMAECERALRRAMGVGRPNSAPMRVRIRW